MNTKLYNPFLDFKFDNTHCFLTGVELPSADEVMPVFPTWLMRLFELEDKPFKMLDESMQTYQQLKLPTSAAAASLFDALDEKVEKAMRTGFEGVKDLDQLTLFQWVSKILYGVVFSEIQAGLRQSALSGEEMNFSQALVHKFRNLHLMLQSIALPMVFEEVNPFKIEVFEVDNPEHTFMYRDEINTLVFSLRMHDFAIIATLQDNGTNAVFHEQVLGLVKGKKLHPIQFEEICARYFYSAYLFNRLPDYTVMEINDKVYVEPMPLNDWTMKPIFDVWVEKTYGQVLESFWKPWGFVLFEIIKDPDNPMSFLLDKEGKFVAHIELPR